MENPSPTWNWVGIIGGLVALGVAVVALPTVFQMFFGKSKLDISYPSSNGYKLWCWIKDKRINSKFLIWCGVTRSSINISYLISAKDTNGKTISLLAGINSSNDIRIEIAEYIDGRVILRDKDYKYGHLLNTGLYKIKLNIVEKDTGRDLHEKERQFRVNSSEPFIEWVSTKRRVKLVSELVPDKEDSQN